MANECREKIEKFEMREEKYKRIIEKANKLNKKYLDINNDIKLKIEELRKKTINTKEAVDNINKILKYSGFEGFKIELKEVDENNIPKYYLKRLNSNEDDVFNTLSEGEKNFISFLYFYQLCIGTDNIDESSFKKKIIVIDDPVSSLDSNVLFIISSLIRILLRPKEHNKREFRNNNFKQFFILTHNLYFYKEVSFNKRIIKNNEINHYKVYKVNNQTKIEKVTKQVIDDYSLMWSSLKEVKENLPNNKSMNIFIANTMRRIIESYVNFIGMGDSVWLSLIKEDEMSPKYQIKSAFISIINDESHKIGALDNVYYQKIINEEPQILFEVFEDIFNDIGKEHYELMMK